MKQSPQVFYADEIKHWPYDADYEDGTGFHPCRPLFFTGLKLRIRLRVAWLVFTGQCDAVKWYEPNDGEQE